MDAGCSFRAMKSSLELIETSMNQIEAIFVTHEHIDHVKGLLQLTKHTKIPVFASPGLLRSSAGTCTRLFLRKYVFTT